MVHGRFRTYACWGIVERENRANGGSPFFTCDPLRPNFNVRVLPILRAQHRQFVSGAPNRLPSLPEPHYRSRAI
jgi:hypothetical protein